MEQKRACRPAPLADIRRWLFSEPWLAGCLLGLVIGLAWYASERLARDMDAELRRHWLGQAVALAQNIDPEDAAALTYTRDDITAPVFERMRSQLVAYGRMLPESRWLYVMARRDGQILFGPDNVAFDDPEGWDPPGTVYAQAPAELVAWFGGTDGLILGPYTDEFGTYVSALAPVIDPPSGKVAMVVGLDITVEQWQERVRYARVLPVLPALLLLLLLWLGLRVVAWRGRLPVARQFRWHHLETGFTVVFGLALTACVALLVDFSAMGMNRRAFAQVAGHAAEPIRHQFVRIRDQLAAIARFASLYPEMGQNDFCAFAAPMARTAPVIAFAWLPRVMDDAGEVHYPVTLVEPLAGNEPALGFDLASEPVRRATIEAAFAAGLATSSPPVMFVHAGDDRPGTLVFQPVFGEAGELRGLVMAVLRMTALFETAMAQLSREGGEQLHLRLFDLPPQGNPTMLAEHPGEAREVFDATVAALLDEATYRQPLFAFGRAYVLAATPDHGFIAAHPRHAGWMTAMAGVILTASMAIFIGFLRERRISFDATMHERTTDCHIRERRYRAFMDSTTDLAFIKDAEFRYLFVNQANQEFFGRAETEILGRRDDELMPPENVPHCRQTDRQVMDDRRMIIFEERVGERIFEVRKFPVPLPNGQIGIGGLVRDATVARQEEERRQESERRAFHNQKLESLGVMAGGIAHDFNNLLAAIQGNAELALLKLLPDDANARKSIEDIVLATKNAAGLTRQLMAYVGKTRSEMQVVELNRLLGDNLDMFRASIGRGIELRFVPAAQPIEIKADPNQAQQVIMNLLTNAAEAMGEARGGITLAAGTDEYGAAALIRSRVAGHSGSGKYAWVEVSDTGCGMDEATLQRMFDPFFTTKKEGHGLGMSTMLGIVRRHHGAIFVDSELGRGTTIRVLFPPPPPSPAADPVKSKADEAVPSVAPVAPSPAAALSGAVLVIDDERMFLSFCSELIAGMGCQPLSADNGEDGIRIYREHSEEIACVLLDMVMPGGMDGIATFDALRELSPNVPIIICSGLPRREVARRLGLRHPAGFVQKPFAIEVLKEELAKAMGQDAVRRDGQS